MNERLSQIFKNPVTIPVTVAIVSFGTGIGLGYILGKRNQFQVYEVHPSVPKTLDSLTTEDLDILRDADKETPKEVDNSKEIDIGKEFVSAKLKRIADQPEEEIEEPKETLEQSVEVVVVEQNIFAGDTDDWNYETELGRRSKELPYILHKDEFYDSDTDYTQMTLTWYEGDKILADEDDQPIYNHNSIVGPLLFGHGSGDPNVVYVRSDKNRAEYEILRHEGLYSVEVAGLDIQQNARIREVKHSAVQKFRPD